MSSYQKVDSALPAFEPVCNEGYHEHKKVSLPSQYAERRDCLIRKLKGKEKPIWRECFKPRHR